MSVQIWQSCDNTAVSGAVFADSAGRLRLRDGGETDGTGLLGPQTFDAQTLNPKVRKTPAAIVDRQPELKSIGAYTTWPEPQLGHRPERSRPRGYQVSPQVLHLLRDRRLTKFRSHGIYEGSFAKIVRAIIVCAISKMKRG